jgi:hypothetical protein
MAFGIEPSCGRLLSNGIENELCAEDRDDITKLV